MGGITFCGMVPQRAIPFAMVCVLGLGEGAFPRRPSDGGIDLMARIRRLGDRDVTGDDRYLFLETVMSARKRLHLSYIGQGVRDGKHRNPAAPLAELLAELDRTCGNAPDDRDARGGHGWCAIRCNRSTGASMARIRRCSPSRRRSRHAVRRGREMLPRFARRQHPRTRTLPDPLPLATLEGFFAIRQGAAEGPSPAVAGCTG